MHDIHAIIEALPTSPESGMGVLEMRGQKPRRLSRNTDAFTLRESMEKTVANFPESARFALACTNFETHFHTESWIQVAQDFCRGDIAGVVVLECGNTDPHKFLSSIPPVLWSSAMPVLYDETGLLEKFSPSSSVLAHDSRLSFVDIEPLLNTRESNGKELLGIGVWSRGAFPIVDVTGSDVAIAFVRRVASSCLASMDSVCRRILAQSDIFPPSGKGQYKLVAGALAITRFIDRIIPQVEISKRLLCLGDNAAYESSEKAAAEIQYAVSVQSGSVPELDEIRDAAKQAETLCLLIANVFKQNHVLFDHDSCDGDGSRELCGLVSLFGIQDQIDAYRQGVPVEDLIA